MSLAHADVVIDAPADVVWRAMLDLDDYPQWNPFIVRVDRPNGRPPRVGDALTLHVRFRTGRGVRSRERITRIEPQTVLEYEFYGYLHRTGLVRGRRIQEIRTEGGATRYHTEERFHGALTFLVPVRAVQDGFRRHARALKRYAEGRTRK